MTGSPVDAPSGGTSRRDGRVVPVHDHVRVARPVPDLGTAALDALRRTGIAARLVPAVGAVAGERLELWVDALELDDAATVLASVLRHAGRPAADLGLVAGPADLADLARELGADLDPVVDAVAPDDAPPGGDRSGAAAADPSAPEGTTRHPTHNPTPSPRAYPTPARPVPPPPVPADGDDDLVDRDETAGTGDIDDVDDPDDHFRPAEPEPLRRLSRTTMWALAVLAAGVVALAVSGLAPTLVGAYAALTSLLGTAAVFVGVGMLVTRLRDDRRPDDGDDGAVL